MEKKDIQARKFEREYSKKVLLFGGLCVLSILLAQIPFLSSLGYFLAVVFFIVAVFFFRERTKWGIGAEGEESVAEYLKGLGESYVDIHDVTLPYEKGNIDHIVLGHNGIFVIETKNHNGTIICDGDEWIQEKIGRKGTPYTGELRSPSKQVKRNIIIFKNFLRKHYPKLSSIWINGIVVFTNEEAILDINNPTVAVLRPEELCNFIRGQRIKTKILMDDLKKLEDMLTGNN